nr:hypothetical protein [Tanacetum cinerariifolium]
MVLNTLGCGDVIEEMLEIKVYEIGGDEVLFTSEAWRCAFDINEPIYTELCHDFYATYKFKEEVLDEELTNDDHFNANEYWLSISSEDELILSRSLAKPIRSPMLKVLQKMITYGLCQRTIREIGTQRESMIYCEQFMTMLAKRIRVLTKDVLNRLSSLTYFTPLDATTLRELIGSNGMLIAEYPTPNVPRVAMHRPPHPTI